MIEEAKVPPNFEGIFVEYALKKDEFNVEAFKTPQVNIVLIQI